MSIDADDLRILGHVEQACSQTGVEWMLVGALARDIHLIEIAGIVPSRATNDVDIAVAVESWESFTALKDLLISSRKFVTSNNAQRLLGVDDLDGRQLDIVPFGEGIRDESSLIRWPLTQLSSCQLLDSKKHSYQASNTKMVSDGFDSRRCPDSQRSN